MTIEIDKHVAILIGCFIAVVVVILTMLVLTSLCVTALHIVPESSRAEGYLTMICAVLI